MLVQADLPGGRRQLTLEVGPYSVAVTEVPGASLTDAEWRDIQHARQSYGEIWGGSSQGTALLTFDPMDGRGPDSMLYDARHYLASVRDRRAASVKLVTARSVALRPETVAAWRSKHAVLLPPEMRLWRVRTDARSEPLWVRLQSFAGELASHDDRADARVVLVGRLAAFHAGRRQPLPQQRDRTAIAWAAIQALATRDSSSLLYTATVRPDLAAHALAIGEVRMCFDHTEGTLGLPRASVTLDNDLAAYHKLTWPGYWVHSDDAADALTTLLEQGRLSVADLRPTMARLVEAESAIGGAGRELEELLVVGPRPDHRRLATLLTRPRLFQYLAPLLCAEEPLSRMSYADLGARLLFETRDAPYSCTMLADRWAASARALLAAAERRYSGATA